MRTGWSLEPLESVYEEKGDRSVDVGVVDEILQVGTTEQCVVQVREQMGETPRVGRFTTKQLDEQGGDQRRPDLIHDGVL